MGEEPDNSAGATQRQAPVPQSSQALRFLDWILIASLTIGGGIFAGAIIWLMAVR